MYCRSHWPFRVFCTLRDFILKILIPTIKSQFADILKFDHRWEMCEKDKDQFIFHVNVYHRDNLLHLILTILLFMYSICHTQNPLTNRHQTLPIFVLIKWMSCLQFYNIRDRFTIERLESLCRFWSIFL